MTTTKTNPPAFDDKLFDALAEGTLRRCAELGKKHGLANKPYIERTIKDLKRERKGERGRAAAVLSGGPSLHRNKHIQVLKEEGFAGRTIATDGSMGHCLRHGVVPDYVLTVDPDPHRIIRWFGDTRLHERPEDDYFRRQDIDPELNADEIRRNDELIELVNRHGPEITLVISTSVTPEITERALEAGMKLYWWTPLYDDPDQEGSLSRFLKQELGTPFMTTGGNVGSSCWVFAQAVLQADPVLMVGMDFSYPPGTDVYNTQYYDQLKKIYPDDPAKGLVEIHNPHLDQTWRTDPAYHWYAECFRRMLAGARGRTVNCTEGGILFGQGVEWATFRQALRDVNAQGGS